MILGILPTITTIRSVLASGFFAAAMVIFTIAFFASPNALANHGTATDHIIAGEIADGAVGTDEIADDSITIDKLAGRAVHGSNIVINSISSGEIGINAVGNGEMQDNAIGSNEIIDASVQMADLAQGVQDAISAGGAPAPDSITATELADDSVTAAEIVDGTITQADLSAAAVSAFTDSTPADDSVTAAKVVDGAITADKIGDNEVTAAKLANGAIDDAAKIADGVITAEKLDAGIEFGVADDSVTGAKIAEGAIEVVGSARQPQGVARAAQNPNAHQVQIAPGTIGLADFGDEVNQVFRRIEGDIDRLDEGIAMSHAIGMMKVPDGKDFGVSFAGGFYQDKQAAAIGLSFRPADGLLFSAGASYGFDSEEVGGGVSVNFGF